LFKTTVLAHEVSFKLNSVINLAFRLQLASVLQLTLV